MELPTGTIVSILAERFKQNYVYSAETVFITTLYSIITIPATIIILM